MTGEATRRAFVERVRQENEDGFGPPARQAAQKLLSAVLPHPWMYVYELTQNALDAKAHRVYWKSSGETVLFQHDGRDALNESHVKGIASLGASTKGLTTVGFMGVGFKSVFARFRVARVSGFGWRFAFRVATRTGDFGSEIPKWFDTLRPVWDEDAPDPEDGYTTIFAMEYPAEKATSLPGDIERLASPGDLTPLAILALRGLEQVRVNDVVWGLSVKDGVVKVACADYDKTWQTFISRYRPNDDAMRRFLEVRQETQDQVDSSGQRVEREAVALLPLDDDGLPKPPKRGKVYATLPTQVRLPFGFHLQADWFVNVDRQNVRDVTGDPWQQSIVDQAPELVRQILVWLSEQSDAVRERGYAVLQDPGADDGPLAKPFLKLRKRLRSELDDLSIVPVHGTERRSFCSPSSVVRMPRQFRNNFGSRADWRPELLFGCDLMDENLLGKRGMSFARWLGWKRKVDFNDIDWSETLPVWWEALPDDERFDALFALWDSVREHGWNVAPVVPTDSGDWVTASQTVWLNEEPPTDNEPSGRVVAEALAGELPKPEIRVSASLRARVNRENNAGTQWLKSRHKEARLADVVKRACDAADDTDDLPLVEIFEWALCRGEHRQDLVPLVLTENGAREPNEALLADPLLEGGSSRRILFDGMPALAEKYRNTDHDIGTVVRFLEQLGVKGGGELVEETSRQYSRASVASLLGIDATKVREANRAGYTVIDYKLPFDVLAVSPEAVQDWLSREHSALQGMGRCFAKSRYYGIQRTEGRPAAWVDALQNTPWVLCTDGQRRRPGEILPKPDSDYEDVPIAEIDSELAGRLEVEGIRFGIGLSKSPALRRLALLGAGDMPDGELAELIHEAKRRVEEGSAERNELTEALKCVRIRGRFPLDRVVERAGPGAGIRGDLGGWVVALPDMERELSDALQSIGLDFPATTTGSHALEFLRKVWKCRPKSPGELGGHIATAYRYILDDSESDRALFAEWRKRRAEAQLFGERSWHPLGSALAVDDVLSPLVRGFLPADKVVVTSTHLGDSISQVRRVAEALNLNLLSENVSVQPGNPIREPSWFHRLRDLVKMLAALDGRQRLDGVLFYDTLALQVGEARHDIRAYIDDDSLKLAGTPSTFATEAAGQLVAYFQLGQRGAEVAWLTGALFALENEEGFARNIKVLADGLGLDLGELLQMPAVEDLPDGEAQSKGDEAPEKDADRAAHKNDDAQDVEVDDNATAKWDTDGAATSGADSKRGQATGAGSPSGGTRTDSGGKKKLPGADKPERTVNIGRAADQVRWLLVQPVDHGGGADKSQPNQSGRIDDRKARQAVIAYEKQQGRQAKAMADQQPGFDVISIDPASDRCRRIEVKGVQGKFEGEASVLMTARQVHDAIRNDDENIEYWLYVVDSTETDSPRVFPIPWARHRSRIRYGFYANAWADDAE